MYSVTKRISMIKQPRGGYINKKELVVTQLDDGITLNENENIHASLVGLAVDYMTRFLMGAQKEEAFSISLKGALALDLFTGNKKQSSMKNATSLLADIKGLDKKSITNACKLVGYDVCFRAGIIRYKPVEEINPDKDTIENYVTMILAMQDGILALRVLDETIDEEEKYTKIQYQMWKEISTAKMQNYEDGGETSAVS